MTELGPFFSGHPGTMRLSPTSHYTPYQWLILAVYMPSMRLLWYLAIGALDGASSGLVHGTLSLGLAIHALFPGETNGS